MWFARPMSRLPYFLGLLSRVDRLFQSERPDGVVLIDYPGFNWWVARRAKAHGIPVFYYGCPQVWGWAPWRVRKLIRLTDHVLCQLPFEEEWLRQRGCRATYVGHPYFDQLAAQDRNEPHVDDRDDPCRPLITILPGSRSQEVGANLPWFLAAAQLIRAQHPDVRFAIASFNPQQAEIARRMAAQARLEVAVESGRTAELIRASTCCLACSGSVSLELMYYGKPAVILYWIRYYAYAIQSWFRTVPYISLPNMLAADDLRRDVSLTIPMVDHRLVEGVVYPEFLTWKDVSPQMAEIISRWLAEPALRGAIVQQLKALREAHGHAGASRRAAQYLDWCLPRRKQLPPRPHFVPRPPATAPR
jgi:lipid-A-disaccharide synthase